MVWSNYQLSVESISRLLWFALLTSFFRWSRNLWLFLYHSDTASVSSPVFTLNSDWLFVIFYSLWFAAVISLVKYFDTQSKCTPNTKGERQVLFVIFQLGNVKKILYLVHRSSFHIYRQCCVYIWTRVLSNWQISLPRRFLSATFGYVVKYGVWSLARRKNVVTIWPFIIHLSCTNLKRVQITRESRMKLSPMIWIVGYFIVLKACLANRLRVPRLFLICFAFPAVWEMRIK